MRFFRVPWYVRLLLFRRVWSSKSVNGTVCLTFDDGPIPEVTPWVLDQLKAAGMKATFFCVGENVRKHPEIYERIISEGHQVGNHTMRHEKGTQQSTAEYLNSVEEASGLVQSRLFRPPYGRLTFRQSQKLRKRYKLVMWSWLSYDYDPEVPVDEIIRKADRQVRSGDILVFHDNVKSFDRLKVILPGVLEGLQRKGLGSRSLIY